MPHSQNTSKKKMTAKQRCKALSKVGRAEQERRRKVSKIASDVLSYHKPRQGEKMTWLRAQMVLTCMTATLAADPSQSITKAVTAVAETMHCRKTTAAEVWKSATSG